MTRTSTSKAAPAKTAKLTRHPVAKATAAPAKKRSPAAKATAAPAKKRSPAAKASTVARKAPATAKPVVKNAKSVKAVTDMPKPELKEKAKKVKLIRDSFTMPEAEYAVLGEVKKACLKAGIEVKKSELLRVGVALIRQLDNARIQEILAGLPTLKAGRPKKIK